MSLQYSDREVVILCNKCKHNRGTFIYKTESMSGVAECNNCSHGVIIYFLRDSKLAKFEKDYTNI